MPTRSRFLKHTVWATLLCVVLPYRAAFADAVGPADSAPAPGVADVIARLGLVESATPVRERAGW
jgi:hypothetical protein